MCGIFGCLCTKENFKEREYYIGLSKRIRHRGPDWSGIYYDQNRNIAICHERLSIVGVDSGSQPIFNKDLNIVLSVNGEIYNYQELYNTVLHNKYIPNTHSDCEVIIYLYKEFGPNFVKMLDGIFSFVLYDLNSNVMMIARDPIGIIPLYEGTNKNNYYVSSEMKVIQDDCDKDELISFEPGTYKIIRYDDKQNLYEAKQKYYNPLYLEKHFNDYDQNMESIKESLRNSLIHSVEKRLMAEVPFGVLLSGGLDSSLIASITNDLVKNKGGTNWGNKLHSFSIGLKGAPDLKYAKIVADYLGTVHHEINFTVQDGIDCLHELIYNLETYDVTTIRASTPMFLLSRIIKSMGIKMVLSGEGADEVFGGYLYFHNAPNDDEFHNECKSRVNNLHHFDCLRANKSTMSWGVEARVPFLDKSFLEKAMVVHPNLKLSKENTMEKHILRSAFDCNNTQGQKYLPEEILWRQKEQFSDGVGYNWIDDLKKYTESSITDEEMAQVNKTYEGSEDIPRNKEELFYRKIFDKLFPNRSTL